MMDLLARMGPQAGNSAPAGGDVSIVTETVQDDATAAAEAEAPAAGALPSQDAAATAGS